MSRFTLAVAVRSLTLAVPCGFAIAALIACGQAKPRESTKTAHSEVEAARPWPSAPSERSASSDAGAELQIADAELPRAETQPAACDPNAAPSPLAEAAFAGDVEGARLLIVAAEQDASTPHCLKTPLMMALSPYPEQPDAPPSEARARRAGKRDAAGLFLTRCFDVSGTDAHGLTALHVAVRSPDPEHKLTRLVQRMLTCGAPPDPQTDEGVTPLMLAVEAKRKKLAEVLLEGGADINLQSHAGKSALQLAEETHDRTLIKLLRKPMMRDAGTD